MSVIIRLQNLPWSANALDIRNFFRGLSIPEGGVHIVGGELGDAFIAFSTDEDARQAMVLNGGKVKEIQVKLLLSSRSEMHKVIEAARQSVPLMSLAAPAPVTVAPVVPVAPTPAVISVPQPIIPAITPFSAALGNTLSGFGIPGIGNPQEIPQPAVIEPPAPLVSPSGNISIVDDDKDDESDRRQSREKDRRRSRTRSRSRDRNRKYRKRYGRDRSRSRERRRRDRSRSRERRDRERDRKERSRSRDRSPSRRLRDRRNDRVFSGSQENSVDMLDHQNAPFPNMNQNTPQMPQMFPNNAMPNGPVGGNDSPMNRFNDPCISETFTKLQELGKKRNPNAFQGEPNGGGGRVQNQLARGGMSRGGGNFRREGRASRFENDQQRDCCVAIRNAPNHTSYGDVRRFFPFMIDKHGIKMINDNMGRRTGNIYVRFCETRSKQVALQRKLNELKSAQVIVESIDDGEYETAVDSFLPYRDDNDDEEPIRVVEPEPKPQEPLSVIKMTDLPNFVKEHDIIKSFSDFSLLSIMLNDCRITRSKTAYIQFVKIEDARQVLERKDRYMFGRRQATVTAISVSDYEKEKQAQNEKMQEQVPQAHFSPQIEPQIEVAAPRDPRQRRQQNENGPKKGGNDNFQGPPQGASFFSPPFTQQQVFPGQFPQFGAFPGPGGPGPGGPGSGMLDPRTGPSNWGNRAPFPNNNMMDQKATTIDLSHDIMDNERLDCVLMKGLPTDATDRTIVTFLSDTGAVPARIHLMLDSNGMPSGDCFCEFRSQKEASMAHIKHGKNLEGSRVSIDLVPRSVVEEALEGPKLSQDGILGNGPQQMQQQFYDSNMRGGEGGGFRGSFRGRGSFDRGGYDRGGFNRGGFDGRGGSRGRGNFNDRGRGFDRGGRGRGRGFARSGFNDNVRNDDDQDPALNDFGAPGCVVSMENVPFRASIDDIMDFFSEFELTQDDVIRRYNERGQATGDARVAFRTPFDAQRAVKTRHMDMIHDRRISLCVL